jgi:surface carbohydrate biosynthesis protein
LDHESQYRENQSNSRKILFDLLARYCVDRRIRPVFVVQPGKPEAVHDQEELIRESFNANFLVAGNEDPFSSYDAVMAARVTLGDQSTMLREALGRGKRILSVNMTDDPSLDFPMDGPWLLRRPTYEQFAERMDWIRGMSDAQWAGVIGDAPRRLVNYNPAYPTHVFVKDLVMAIAEDRPWPEVTW